jgi:heterodisulfide reductase subunit A-like polyferredoxin
MVRRDNLMAVKKEVLIIGGGVAGLSAVLGLS